MDKLSIKANKVRGLPDCRLVTYKKKFISLRRAFINCTKKLKNAKMLKYLKFLT